MTASPQPAGMGLRWSSSEQMLAAVNADALAGHAPLGDHVSATIDGLSEARVSIIGLRGEEHTNHLYRFDVVASISGLQEPELRAQVLGRKMTVRLLREAGEPRSIFGIIAHAELLAYRDGHFVYHLAIVPKLWLATKTTDTRVFSDVTVQDIVTEVLREHGVVHAWSLAKAYERREYVLQYDETDYDFIARILAEAGIFFTFEHPPNVEALRERLAMGLPNALGGELVGLAQRDFSEAALADAGGRLLQGSTWMQAAELQSAGELMVLGDTASSYGHIDGVPELSYHASLSAGAMSVAEHHVEHFSVRSAVEPSRATVRDYDHERAQIRLPGTVLGTFRAGYQGALADGVSAAATAADGAVAQAGGELAGVVGAAGPIAQATGVSLTDPGGALGGLNENRSHGVITATHAVMAPEIAIARSAVAVAAELAGQVLGQAGLAAAAGSAARDALGGPEASLEIYEHHGEYEEPEASFELARTRLEQLRAEHILCSGLSHCSVLSPGHRFELNGHELSQLNRSYALTEVIHELFSHEDAGATYQNHFVCIPDDVAARPHVPHRRFHQAVETAVVVGPQGQEIATEHLGKIKVQFHWDRNKKHDEHSSCWIRVMQPWAGAGFGFQFIPRIGMEVLVSFIGGDMNRPVVVGCLPNMANRPPYHLPEHKTQSGIRTRSSLGGGGHNELMFDDHSGRELVLLRAQHNHREEVGHDQLVAVEHHQRMTIGGNRTTEISGASELRIGLSGQTHVGGSLSQAIGGSLSSEIGEARTIAVRGSDQLRVHGGRVVVVGEQLDTIVGTEGRGHMLTTVHGNYHVASTRGVRINGGASIELCSGDTNALIEPAGVTLKAKAIKITAEDDIVFVVGDNHIRINQDGIQMKAKRIQQQSDGAFIELASDATVNGARVLLNCGAGEVPAAEGDDSSGGGQATFQITLPEGLSGATITARIMLPDGNIDEREVDSSGMINLNGLEGDHFRLVDLLVDGEPTGFSGTGEEGNES